MARTTGQGESDGYSAVRFWNKDIALSMEVRKRAVIPLPDFALVAQCFVGGLSRCTKDADLKMEQLLPRFAVVVSD